MTKFTKLFAIVLTLILALAGTNTALAQDYDELVIAYEQASRALWYASDWQSVIVPWGVWEIGKDIPAGKWRIETATYTSVSITYSSKVHDGGSYLYISDASFEDSIKSPNRISGDPWDVVYVDLDMRKGSYLQVKYTMARLTPIESKENYRFPAGSMGNYEGKTFQELLEVREEIAQAIRASDQWRVEVIPEGKVTVGRDMAGAWHVAPVEGERVNIDMGQAFFSLTSPLRDGYNPFKDNDSFVITLEEGMNFEVEQGDAVFSTFIGKKDLIFE